MEQHGSIPDAGVDNRKSPNGVLGIFHSIPDDKHSHSTISIAYRAVSDQEKCRHRVVCIF